MLGHSARSNELILGRLIGFISWNGTSNRREVVDSCHKKQNPANWRGLLALLKAFRRCGGLALFLLLLYFFVFHIGDIILIRATF